MIILVTGGNGMVGRNLKESSLDDVKNLWLFPSSMEMDLMSLDSIDSYFNFNKPDVIIHLAANVGGLFKNLKYKVEMFRDNIIMNENILFICNKFNVQYGLFCCSTCVFSSTPTKYPMTEDMILEGNPHKSNESYGYAKRMLYFQCKNYNEQYGRKYVCISPCNIYGKYDNFNLSDSHVVAGLIHKFYLRSIQKSEIFQIKTGLESRRQFLYAPDLCRIIITMVNSFDKINYDHIILSSNSTKIVDLIKIISNYFTNVKYEIIDEELGQSKKDCSNELLIQNFEKIEFKNIEFGIDETIRWFLKDYGEIRK